MTEQQWVAGHGRGRKFAGPSFRNSNVGTFTRLGMAAKYGIRLMLEYGEKSPQAWSQCILEM